MRNEMINSVFDNYIKQENTDFALLFTAKWGVGKTYYVKDYLENQKNVTIKTAYISLYGLSSTKEIDSQIFAKLYPGKNSIKKYGGLLLKIVSKNLDVSDFFKFDISEKTKEKDGKSIEGNFNGLEKIIDLITENPDTNNSEKILICLDDLERRNDSFTLKEICGYINFLTESGFKVLVISNNEKIDNQDFKALKEKTFGLEVEFNPDTKSLAENVIKSIFTKDEQYKIFLLSQVPLFMDVFFQHSQNLRVFKLILHKFKDVWKILEDKKEDFENINLENYWSSILRFMCAITIECKEGKLLFEHKKDISSIYQYVPTLLNNEVSKSVIENKQETFASEDFLNNYYESKEQNYKYYQSLFDFIFKGLLDEEKLFIEFKEIDEIILDPAQIAINKCSAGHIGKISDAEFAENLTLIRDFAYNKKYKKIQDYRLVIEFLELHAQNYNIDYSQSIILSSIKEILISESEKEIITFLNFRKEGKHEDILNLINKELSDRQNYSLRIIFEQNNSTELIKFLENNISKPIFLNQDIANNFFNLIKSTKYEDLFEVKHILSKRYFSNWIENYELEFSSKKHLVSLIENYIKIDLGETNKRNERCIFEDIAKYFAKQTE